MKNFFRKNIVIFRILVCYFGLSSILIFSLGIDLEFYSDPEKLNVTTMKVSRILKDSVWVKPNRFWGRGGRRRGEWNKVLEVHFQDRPMYLSYSTTGYDLYYALFYKNCWKIYEDSSLTIWYEGELNASEKYPLKSVINGSQVEQLTTGVASVYASKELKVARGKEAAFSYKAAGVMGVITLVLIPFVFRRKKGW